MSDDFVVAPITNIIAVESNECAICLECVTPNKNSCITECGHKFHTSCLLKSCDRGNFNCPLCRNNLINEKREQDNFINLIDNYLSDQLETIFTLLSAPNLNELHNSDRNVDDGRIIPIEFNSLTIPSLPTNHINHYNIIDRFMNLPFHNANH